MWTLRNEIRVDNRIEKVPFYTGGALYAGGAAGLSSRAFFLDAKAHFDAQQRFYRAIGSDEMPSFDFPGHLSGIFGGEIRFPETEKVAMPIALPVVRTAAQVDTLTVPSLSKNPYVNLRFAFEDRVHQAGGMAYLPCGTLDTAATICDLQLLLTLMQEDTARYHRLMRIVVRFLEELGDRIIDRYGADRCIGSASFPADSLLPPEDFRTFSLPYFDELLHRFLAKGVTRWSLHLCGNQTHNLPAFGALALPPGSFLSLDKQIRLQDADRHLGSTWMLGGQVSTVTLSSGLPEEVYEEAANTLVRWRNRPGGFALMPSCSLPINTPPENIRAMRYARDHFGTRTERSSA